MNGNLTISLHYLRQQPSSSNVRLNELQTTETVFFFFCTCKYKCHLSCVAVAYRLSLTTFNSRLFCESIFCVWLIASMYKILYISEMVSHEPTTEKIRPNRSNVTYLHVHVPSCVHQALKTCLGVLLLEFFDGKDYCNITLIFWFQRWLQTVMVICLRQL
jgi:hypothetical protein